MPPESTAGSMPFRARLSLLHQRVILFVRWCFRIPIDEIQEQQALGLRRDHDALAQAHRKLAVEFVRLVQSSLHMQLRLQYYEEHIPRMRELRRTFELEQARLAQLSKDKTDNELVPMRPSKAAPPP